MSSQYVVEDFADEVDCSHPLALRRIPVIGTSHPRWRYHVALVIGGESFMPESSYGLEPEPHEAEQLLAYLEKMMRYYRDSYRALIAQRGPFDVDDTVNTQIFKKTNMGWVYRAASWTQGPIWSSRDTDGELESLLDVISGFGNQPSQTWLDLKRERPLIWRNV